MAVLARVTSAQRNAGTPARRSASMTLVSALLVASYTSLMIPRTDAPRPVPDVRIYEVVISHRGRTYAQGKKIGWEDGFHVIYCTLKYNILRK